NDRLPRIARLLPEYVARREWHTAAHALHMLLDTPPGVLTRRVEMDADGKPYVHWHSPQVRVTEIFAKLPPEARKVYSQEYGRPARELLAKAKKGDDPRPLTEIVERHLYTDSGPEALALLAQHHADARRYFQAALAYAALLRHPRADPTPRQL